jgi:hypothetical protein
MLCAVMPHDIMPNEIILSVITFSVIMLSILELSVFCFLFIGLNYDRKFFSNIGPLCSVPLCRMTFC